MNKNEIIALDKEYIANTYGRYELAPIHGKNAEITDQSGQKYIDFTSGIGVNSLGISDDTWVNAVTSQLKKIQHISNYYFSEPSAKLAETLVKQSNMSKVIFQNSGAEANEAVIKLARKYSFDKYGKGRSNILTLTNSFHGRTITTLAATGQDVFHDFFFPFTDGFRYIPINDISTLKNSLDGSICAIICELIQGEGGVNIIDKTYLHSVKKICDENDILLLFDEVQTGIGRTGKLFAFQHFGVQPDAFTLAKGLGGGLPIGCVVIGEKCKSVLSPGQHGSTFAANPAVCAGANVVLDRILSDNFLTSVTEKGEYIKSKILSRNFPCVTDIRGLGLMIGVEVTVSHKTIAKLCLENGLLILTAGTNVLRMLPPLTIPTADIDHGISILCSVLESLS